jgi:malonyl-CoA O-methyltransferase
VRVTTGDAGVARHFSRAAAQYHRLTEVQERVAARLAELLVPLPAPARILEIGCGTGHFTRLLRRRFPAARLCAVDIAEPMILQARQRLPDPGIEWVVADVRAGLPEGRFDLVAGSSSLHWMTPLERLFPLLRARLVPGGDLVFSVMRDGSLPELREARRLASPRKEPRGHLPSTAEVTGALAGAGFRVLRLEEQSLVSRHPDAAAFLSALRQQGVTGGEFSRGAVPLTRGELQALTTEYERHFPHPEGGIRATYEALHIHARA